MIEEVYIRPLLYDLSHNDYQNLRNKDYGWKEIAVRTKLSGNEQLLGEKCVQTDRYI